MNETKTTLSCMDNSRGFQIAGLRGYTLSIGIGAGHYCENHSLDYDATCGATSTMEVAVMNDLGFVCLPYDVAGHVPAGNLGSLIEAVESHDWERVCFLCGEDNSDPQGKFPRKSLLRRFMSSVLRIFGK